MDVVPHSLAVLIDKLGRLPGIGRKTATRLALHLLRRPPEESRALAASIAGLHGSIRLCSRCLAFSEEDPCALCADPRRDHHQICVVEGAADMMAIEKSGVYRGVYHLLHGALSPMDGVGPDDLHIRELLARIRAQEIREVLIATSSTVPGEATAALLMERLAATGTRVSRLAFGIPMGMDIQYADEMTLARAIEARRPVRQEG